MKLDFLIIIISQVYCTTLETFQLNQFAALEPASQNVEQIHIWHHTIVIVVACDFGATWLTG